MDVSSGVGEDTEGALEIEPVVEILRTRQTSMM